MPSKKHKPEEIIGKLREVEIVLAQGGTTAEACRPIAVTEQTYYRWRKEYGGLKTDQARRMKDLEKENLRLRHGCKRYWLRTNLRPGAPTTSWIGMISVRSAGRDRLLPAWVLDLGHGHRAQI